MAFRVGQKVVCVDDRDTDEYASPWHRSRYELIGGMDGLTCGEIYTVRRAGKQYGAPAIWLNEISRPLLPEQRRESGYAAARFRPVVERETETGMAILKSILEGKHKVLEDCQ